MAEIDVMHSPALQDADTESLDNIADRSLLERRLVSYDKAVASDPHDSEVWNDRGSTLVALKDYRRALDSYNRAIELRPDNCVAWSNKGLALAFLNRYHDALNAYERAIAIEPDYYQALSSKGFVLSKLGLYEDAINFYNQSLAIEPNDYTTLVNQGLALHRLSLYEDAVQSYDKAISLEPSSEFARRYRRSSLSKLNLSTQISNRKKAVSTTHANPDKGATVIPIQSVQPSSSRDDGAWAQSDRIAIMIAGGCAMGSAIAQLPGAVIGAITGAGYGLYINLSKKTF